MVSLNVLQVVSMSKSRPSLYSATPDSKVMHHTPTEKLSQRAVALYSGVAKRLDFLVLDQASANNGY
jgi:hypothetical protein